MKFIVISPFEGDGGQHERGEIIELPDGHPAIPGLIQGQMIRYDASERPVGSNVMEDPQIFLDHEMVALRRVDGSPEAIEVAHELEEEKNQVAKSTERSINDIIQEANRLAKNRQNRIELDSPSTQEEKAPPVAQNIDLDRGAPVIREADVVRTE